MQLHLTTLLIIYIIVLVPFTKRLISLGALLISTAILMTTLTAQITNSWFAFVLFIVYITGLLVLFRYIISIRPNSYYTKKRYNKTNIRLIALLSVIALTPYSSKIIINPIKGEKRFEQDVTQIFNSLRIRLFWIIGVILLIALLIAVTICYKSAKPMRSYIE